MADPTIDTGTYHALQDSAGTEFVAELVEAFLDDAPKMLATLDRSLANGDEATFRRAAHSLKSNSMTFGARALADIARALEVGARDVVQRGDTAALRALADEQQRVAIALRELRNG